MFMIFAEPGPEDLALLVPCFEIEGRGLRLAAITILPTDAVTVVEVGGGGGALVHEGRQFENQTVLL
jgi:hypothetical protein